MIIDYSIHSVLHQSISPSKKRTMEIAAIDINPVEIVTPEPSVPHTEVRDDVEHHPVNGHALLLDDVGEEKFSKNNSTFKTSIDSGRRPANPGFPVEDEEFLDITHVDTYHADIDIPLSAKSGDMLTVDHDGDEKLIRVPAGGYQGQSIRVKMTRSDEQVESTGILCFSGMSFNEEEKEKPSVYDNLPCTRVDDDHVDIQIPLSAKPGDIITVDHDGDKKIIKVPAGGCEGQSIRVKITRNY